MEKLKVEVKMGFLGNKIVGEKVSWAVVKRKK